MQLDTTTPLQNFDGSDLIEGGLTARTACTNALLGHHPDDERVSGEKKYARFKLACRINDSASVELKAEDVVMLKEMIARSYTPLVVGLMYDLLEANPKA